MGRKIDIKKIENVTKCQVTFSKRRSSLIRKAHEISVFCDVDVALVAFSPSGRVSEFCSRERMEDLIERYINLPPDKRYQHIKNVEEKLEKIKQLDHITGDENKLHFLDNRIKQLELQIKKANVDLEILDINLKDYEPEGGEGDLSMTQILWCEGNLKNALQRVTERKNDLNDMIIYNNNIDQRSQLDSQGQTTFSYNNFNGNDQLQLQQSNSWALRSMLPDVLNKGKGILGGDNEVLGYSFNPPNVLYPSFSPQELIPPTYSTMPFQQHTIIGGYTAPGALDQHSGVSISSSMQQPTIEDLIPQVIPDLHLGNSSMPIMNDDITPVGIPNQQLGVIGSSYMNILNMEIDTAPMSNFDANFYPVNWSTGGSYNTTQNLDATLPLITERNFLPMEFETFSTNIVMTSTSNDENDNNNNSSSDTNEEQQAAPVLLNPTSESPTGWFLNSIDPNYKAENGNVNPSSLVGNQDEDGFAEWDGIALADNFNLEYFDIYN